MRPLSPELFALHRVKNILGAYDRWCQGTAYRYRGRHLAPQYCLGGAITSATDDIYLRAKVVAMFTEVIGTDSIPLWNDAAERTYADIMDVVERAILAAECEWAAAA
jgi:TolB-like protein